METIERSTEFISDKAVEKALKLLNSSERPLVYAGGGVSSSDAAGELFEFVEKLHAPVTLSLMGMGAFPATHGLFTGMVGMHGTKTSNMAVTECDLLVAIGARFSDRVISKLERFAPRAKILHIDVDAAEVNKNIKAECHIIGDVKAVLKRINTGIESKDRSKWLDFINDSRRYPLHSESDELTPQYILIKSMS